MAAGVLALSDAGESITQAARVRALRPDEARRPFRAQLRGVVTTANRRSCVVQDASGPVFVRPRGNRWQRQPAVGETWEFEGVTDPGEFSPIVVAVTALRLGRQEMPWPLRPGWEQLLNGSLDVELIELPGVVLETAPAEIALLTRGGVVRIVSHPDYPLPEVAAPEPMVAAAAKPALAGSLVRVRGVFFAYRDGATLQLVPGRFLLGDGVIFVDEPAPADPFAGPARHVAELLRFSPGADSLRRFKAVGQVLQARPGECFVLDGEDGFRVRTKGAPTPAPGDLVEVVGFPQLGGPSPVLLEATVRTAGHRPLPAPRVLVDTGLADAKHDATRVQVEALLVSDGVRLGERVLELQAGRHPFLARLRLAGPSADPMRPGTRLRLTGVYASLRGNTARDGFDGLELLLNEPADIVVLENAPWWTLRHTLTTLGVLSAGLAALLVWVASLRRTVAQRTALLERAIGERQQVEQRRLLEQERARVAQDLHDDLGAGLAQIGLIASLARRPGTLPERAQDHLAEITGKAREMVTVLDEIVWAINPKHDTAGSVSGYLCDYAQEFLRAAALVCRLETDCARPDQALGSAPRHQLFLAFKEALTNVVKHAGATEVRVRIAAAEAGLDVTVEDNGRGLVASSGAPAGDGLRNMRGRLEKIGGRCEIKPGAAGGTVVALHLPWSN